MMKRENIYKFILLVVTVYGIAMFAAAQEDSKLLSIDTTSATDNSEEPYQQTYNYAFVARAYGDSIVLRWAPDNAGIWLSANYHGWKLMRYKDASEMSEKDTVFKIQLGGKPIKPLTLDEMKEKYDTSDIYVGAAAQALYGAMPNPVDPKNGFENYIFRREQEQTQRQMMAYLAAEMDTKAADALGLRFVDRNVKKGITYTYIMECLVPRDMANTAIKIIDVDNVPFVRQYDDLVPEIQFYQNSPYTAFIHWEKNKLSGYFVERSSDKGKTWNKINDAPIFGYDPDQAAYEVYGDEIGKLLENHVGVIDSLELNKTYQYRVSAFDGFGDYAPTRTSTVFEMEDLIPPSVPVLDFILPEDNKICTLTWHVDMIDDDLEGYVITFSDDPSGPWDRVSDLLPPKTRQWTDENAHDRGRGYYRVFALDKSQNVSYSTSQINNIEDDMPPAPPTGVSAIIDTAGILYMQWNENKERDILGYRVYFANQLDHAFVQRQGLRISDTTFTDTLSRQTITRYVYFYVVAEDNAHNFSAPSDTLAVPIPDIVPPEIAVLVGRTQTDDAVTFTWLRSASNDVAYYYIFRKLAEEKQWKCIHVLPEEELSDNDTIIFTDYPEKSQRNYNYCIEVFDKSRLSSGKSSQTTVRHRGGPTIQVPLTLKGKLNKEKDAVDLEFTYDYNSKNDYYGVVYKSIDDGEFYALGSFKRGENRYIDKKIKAGQKCSYYFQLFLGHGKHSQKSEIVTVKN